MVVWNQVCAGRSTTGELHPTDGQYPFGAWQGFQWSPGDKALLLKKIYGERFRRAVERKVSPDEECDIHLLNTINGLLSPGTVHSDLYGHDVGCSQRRR
jgi:hypothetical protein